MLWFLTWVNIRGLRVGKWISNVGGISTLIIASILIALAGIAVYGGNGSLSFVRSLTHSRLGWSDASVFGVICFGLVGLELGPVMGDEIRDTARSVRRGVLTGGALCGVLYLALTSALILAVPQGSLRVVQGILQAIDALSSNAHLGFLLLPVAILLVLVVAGGASAWLSGSARILFVSGVDRYLPGALGRVHPKYGTPHIALLAMAGLSTLLIAMSFAGSSSIKEAYVTLLDLSVVLQMISYLYLFGALARVQSERKSLRLCAGSGLVTTVLGMVLAFVPSRQVESIPRFEVKMVSTTFLFLLFAFLVFRYYRWKNAAH